MSLYRIDAPAPEDTCAVVWVAAYAERTNSGITIQVGQHRIEIETESDEHAGAICSTLSESFKQAAHEYEVSK